MTKYYTRKTLGEYLKATIEKRGLSVASVAKSLGVWDSQLRATLNGTVAGETLLKQCADYLEVPLITTTGGQLLRHYRVDL